MKNLKAKGKKMFEKSAANLVTQTRHCLVSSVWRMTPCPRPSEQAHPLEAFPSDPLLPPRISYSIFSFRSPFQESLKLLDSSKPSYFDGTKLQRIIRTRIRWFMTNKRGESGKINWKNEFLKWNNIFKKIHFVYTSLPGCKKSAIVSRCTTTIWLLSERSQIRSTLLNRLGVS